MMPDAFLRSVFEEAGMPLSEQQAQAFLRYYDLMTERNKVMNLTAITEFEEAAVRHFTDSCMLFSPALSEARADAGISEKAFVIDVGTGAGFPGIPLKILKPRLSLVLLDALNKRVDFLRDVVTALDLDHTAAVHARAEEGVLLRKKEILLEAGSTDPQETLRETFDLAVSRAVAHLSVLSEYCLPFVRTGGCFAAYKSGAVDEELREAENALKILGGEIASVTKFELPIFHDSRSILLIRKVRETPAKYPRKAGKPGKSPL